MLKIDLHLHTVASRHAYSTVYEYVVQAKNNGMKVIGFADHGPAIEETLTTDIYFTESKRIPDTIDGIRVLKGVEANIINGGEIDIAAKTIKTMDFIMAGLHKHAGFEDRGVKNNTAAIVKLIKSGNINIISHPFLMNYQTDIEKVSEEACKNGVLLEVNIAYLKGLRGPEIHRENVINLQKMIAVVKILKSKVIIGSDAHNIWELGDDSPLKNIKKQIGLTDNLIINNYPKELMKLLKIKN